MILASGAKKLDQEALGLSWWSLRILLSAENLKIPINSHSGVGVTFQNKIYSDFHEKYCGFHQIFFLLSFPLHFHALKVLFWLFLWELKFKYLLSLLWEPTQTSWPIHLPWRGHFMHQDNLLCPGGQSTGESGNGNNWTLIFEASELNFLKFFQFFNNKKKICFLHSWKGNGPKHYSIYRSHSHQSPVYAVELTCPSSFSVTKPFWSFRKIHLCLFLPPLQSQTMTEGENLHLSFSPAKPDPTFNTKSDLLPQ